MNAYQLNKIKSYEADIKRYSFLGYSFLLLSVASLVVASLVTTFGGNPTASILYVVVVAPYACWLLYRANQFRNAKKKYEALVYDL